MIRLKPKTTEEKNLASEDVEGMKEVAARTSRLAPEMIEEAQKLGAQVGVQAYVKDFELEADQLGTIITYNAGYNPLVGAKFFDRIPDPGDRFLGTHPPNAQRVQIVLETAEQLGLSQ